MRITRNIFYKKAQAKVEDYLLAVLIGVLAAAFLVYYGGS
jgi:uncharacterized protein (UPF0333 family)